MISFSQKIAAKYQIISRRMTPLTLFYHGTSSKFLSNILKNGIIPNPKEGVWKGEDEDASLDSPSRKSHEGSYWSDNTMTSLSYANSASRKLGGNPLVVFAMLQDRSALPDEDNFRIGKHLDASVPEVIVSQSKRVLCELLVTLETGEEFGKKAISNFIKSFQDDLDTLAPKMNPEYEKALTRLFKAEVNRRLSFLYKGDFDSSLQDALPREKDENDKWQTKPIPSIMEQKSKAEAEHEYRDALSSVMKISRRAALKEKFLRTLRITDPITYSGRNRIIGIAEITSEQVAGATKYILTTRYGSIPQKWLSEFAGVWSSNFEVVKAS